LYREKKSRVSNGEEHLQGSPTSTFAQTNSTDHSKQKPTNFISLDAARKYDLGASLDHDPQHDTLVEMGKLVLGELHSMRLLMEQQAKRTEERLEALRSMNSKINSNSS
jgi:hypothetical protein